MATQGKCTRETGATYRNTMCSTADYQKWLPNRSVWPPPCNTCKGYCPAVQHGYCSTSKSAPTTRRTTKSERLIIVPRTYWLIYLASKSISEFKGLSFNYSLSSFSFHRAARNATLKLFCHPHRVLERIQTLYIFEMVCVITWMFYPYRCARREITCVNFKHWNAALCFNEFS